MKVFLAFLALGTGAACSAETADQKAIMGVIEATVVLPEEAGALDVYSRNYAAGRDGKIIAYYVIPFESPVFDPDNGCEVMLKDFETRPCTEDEVAEIISDRQAQSESMGNAGQSRWFDDYRELPIVMDGGCSVITIIYDPQSQRIESTQCNAVA